MTTPLIWRDDTADVKSFSSPQNLPNYKGMEAHTLYFRCLKCSKEYPIAVLSYDISSGYAIVTLMAPRLLTMEYWTEDISLLKEEVINLLNTLLHSNLQVSEALDDPLPSLY